MILLVTIFITASSQPSWSQSDSSESLNNQLPLSTYLFAGIGAFIPLSESFRLNYATSVGGLPIELIGGLVFPLSSNTLAPLTVRYLNRKANFLSSTSIRITSIEPGVRVFIEKQRKADLRVFAGVDWLIAQATAHGLVESSQDGTVHGLADAQKDYLDVGVGLDLGFSYVFGAQTALDGIIHASIYFGSPLAHGGLGNIGGVSLDLAYRFGF